MLAYLLLSSLSNLPNLLGCLTTKPFPSLEPRPFWGEHLFSWFSDFFSRFFPYCFCLLLFLLLLLLLFASAFAFAFASAFASADYLLCIDIATKLDDKTFTLSFDTQLHQSRNEAAQRCLSIFDHER